MNVLSELIYRYSVEPYLYLYKEVREDYLKIYEHAYTVPEAVDIYGWDTLSDSELKHRALLGWKTSLEYDPHGAIRTPVQRIQHIKRFITFFFLVVFLIAACLGWGIYQWALAGITVIDTVPKWIISSLPADIVAAAFVYWYLLSADTAVVQKMNEALAISPRRIHGESRDSAALFSYYIWNQSLNSGKKWSIVLFLTLLKLVSSTIYGYVVGILQSNMDAVFKADGILDLFRSLWRRFAEQRLVVEAANE